MLAARELSLKSTLRMRRIKARQTHDYFSHIHLGKCLSRDMTALYYDVYRLDMVRKAVAWRDAGEKSLEIDCGKPMGNEVW